MKKHRYDVVVVGCGPGGAMAGKFAALSGAETLIIDQKRQLGYPVFDSMSIINSKSEMEETTGEAIEPAAVYSKAEGLRYVSLSGKEGKLQPLPDGLFVNRQLFEKSLAIGAARAGAEIMLHTRVVDLVKEGGAIKGVKIKTASGAEAIPCSVVIAADGSYQHMARLAGFPLGKPKINASLGCEFVGVKSLRQPHNIDEIYLAEPAEDIYRYVAPYGPDRCSLGVGTSPEKILQRKGLKQRLDELMRHLEKIGKYDFSKASAVTMLSGGSCRTGLPGDRRLAADGIILVGDAADRPMFGCRWGAPGMLKAAWTGRAAGKIAAEAAKKGNTSDKFLDGEYKSALAKTFKAGEREAIMEGLNVWNKILKLDAKFQERAVVEIGWEIAALHFYSKGGMSAPLPSSLKPAQQWLKEIEGSK